MGKPRRNILSVAEETTNPPAILPPNHRICRVRSAAGNNLYHLSLPDGTPLLAELAQRFRSTIWIKRGGYVVVDTEVGQERDNKIGGEIVNVVRDERGWGKMGWWPVEFGTGRRGYGDDSEEEESVVGKMPPSDEEEEG